MKYKIRICSLCMTCTEIPKVRICSGRGFAFYDAVMGSWWRVQGCVVPQIVNLSHLLFLFFIFSKSVYLEFSWPELLRMFVFSTAICNRALTQEFLLSSLALERTNFAFPFSCLSCSDLLQVINFQDVRLQG